MEFEYFSIERFKNKINQYIIIIKMSYEDVFFVLLFIYASMVIQTSGFDGRS